MSKPDGFFFRRTVGNVTVPTFNMKMLVWMMPMIFIGTGLMWFISGYLWVSSAAEAIGTVTKISTFVTESGQTLFNPEFSYTWTDGSQTVGALGLASPDFNLEIGSQHNILYDPTVKATVRFPGVVFNYFGAIVILVLGAMFTLISLALWLWVKAIARKRDLKKD